MSESGGLNYGKACFKVSKRNKEYELCFKKCSDKLTLIAYSDVD